MSNASSAQAAISDTVLLSEAVHEDIVSTCICVATLSVLVYDSALSLNEEKIFLWPRPTSLVSILYYSASLFLLFIASNDAENHRANFDGQSRYGAILQAILVLIFGSSDADQATYREGNINYGISVLSVIIMCSIGYMLLLRVQVMYYRDRTISIIMYVAFIINVSLNFVESIHGSVQEDARPLNLKEGYTVCEIGTVDTLETTIAWCISSMYGLLLLFLSLYKSSMVYKGNTSLGPFGLLKVLIRGNVLYFSTMILLSIVSIVNITITGASPSDSLVSYILAFIGKPAFLSILGARIMLEMKEAGAQGVRQFTQGSIIATSSDSTVSSIDFALMSHQAGRSSSGEDIEGEGSVYSARKTSMQTLYE